ncbi:SH3 domain-containing protein [Thalassotalea ponticola]|uniref:SH3 domain-containing protein n=1 Tax=Thalassotalea ponticola TaxID=1523392 RepID=UPI0025B3FD8E|nr:SH3 domain-containing protein [Thalassotalea ponticola]MDN3652675.1 SH3 domain-containing protein [Thalassotalea ponticola]
MQFLKSVVLACLCAVSVTALASQEVQVDAPFIDMHSGPSGDFPVFYIAEQGEWIKVIDRKHGYFKVVTEDGTEGWMAEMHLNQTRNKQGQPIKVAPSGIKGLMAKFND